MKLFDRLFGRSMKIPIKKLATFNWKGPEWLLQFDDGDIDEIESNAQVRIFHAGEDVMPPTGAFDGFLLVAAGGLLIRRTSDPAGINFRHARLRAAESFRWNDEFSAVAEGETKLFWLDAGTVLNLVNKNRNRRQASHTTESQQQAIDVDETHTTRRKTA